METTAGDEAEMASGDHERETPRTIEQQEAQIVEAWRSGKYPTKERCLTALGLEQLNNAALWKRVKRAIDRTSRRTQK